MQSHNLKRTSLWLAMTLGLAFTGSVIAQEADTDSDEDENSRPMDTIEVTARRREESQTDVPISLTALGGEALEDVGAQDITYLQQVSPNTTLEVSRGTSNTVTAFIRGVGQQDPVAGFEAGVGIYVDDVYLNRPQAAILDIYDVERVEVLRGPQGTLYGRNTIGGAVKYVTKRLDDEPTAQIRGSLGSFSQQDLVLSGSTVVTDNLRVGAAMASFNRDGYGKNLTTGLDNYNKDVMAWRFTAEWEPGDAWFVRFGVDAYHDDSNPMGGHRLIPGLFSGAPILNDVYDSRGGMEGKNQTRATGTSLTAEYNFAPGWQFKSITAYREDKTTTQIDFDALPAADVDVAAIYDNEQFSQEFQVNFATEKAAGVMGFYYLDANAFGPFDVRLFTTGDLLGLPGLNAFTLGDVDTETWSLFADVSYDLGRNFELSVGGRYTSDERSSRVLRQTMLGESTYFGGTPLVIATTSDFEGSEKFTQFTPRASLSFKPTDTQNLYVSYSQGFKGGSFDPRGLTTAAPDLNGDGVVDESEVFDFMRFEPEEVDSYEIGLKSSWADGRINTALAGFYADYTNIQVPGSIGVDTDGDGVFDTFAGVTTNAGAATVRGIEFEMNGMIASDMNVAGEALFANVALGYIDAEYDEFVTAVSDPATGATALTDVADQRRIQNTPKRTAHVSLNYERPVTWLGTDGVMSLIGAWSYRSKTNQFEIPSEFLDQAAYSVGDAHIVWKPASGRYELGLHARNLFDEQYKTSGYVFATPDGSASTLGLEGVMNAFYGPPRTVTLTAKLNF
ncbi:MAG: TonB-dependent receptor [Wenzhouxiangella sp.]|nr:TonB-dependent receptor [Wenzhouxiangella sp.]